MLKGDVLLLQEPKKPPLIACDLVDIQLEGFDAG